MSLMGIVMLFFIALPSSCTRKKELVEEAIISRDSLPIMKTVGMESLVSDSGVIRYRITAGEWLIFNKLDPSYWSFEDKIHVERFDSLMRVDATIDADTAYFYDKDRLWELRSNVQIVNLEGVKFTTNLLYWNQLTERVYSDDFISIQKGDDILRGYGFEADQQLTNFKIYKPTGAGYINMAEPKTKTDSIQ